MLLKRLIVCLDVRDGRVTKGVRFQGNVDVGDPVEMAARYCADGADEIVFYDITASAERRACDLDMVARAARALSVPFTVGGGIRGVEDMRAALLAGADKVSLNSAALKNPQIIEEVAKNFGSQVCVIAIDANFEDGNWICYLNGGRVPTRRTLFEWAAEAADRGAGEILFTSIAHDGTHGGYACDALRELHRQLPVPVIASGGAGTMAHFKEAFVEGEADAALAAGVFHFGEIAIPELKKYLSGCGIPIRL